MNPACQTGMQAIKTPATSNKAKSQPGGCNERGASSAKGRRFTAGLLAGCRFCCLMTTEVNSKSRRVQLLTVPSLCHNLVNRRGQPWPAHSPSVLRCTFDETPEALNAGDDRLEPSIHTAATRSGPSWLLCRRGRGQRENLTLRSEERRVGKEGRTRWSP